MMSREAMGLPAFGQDPGRVRVLGRAAGCGVGRESGVGYGWVWAAGI